MSEQKRWSRRHLFATAEAASVASVGVGVFGLPQAACAATVISTVDTSLYAALDPDSVSGSSDSSSGRST